MMRRRLYDNILAEHLSQFRQMALISGPRQVGKTTTCRTQSLYYMNWDVVSDQRCILAGADAVAERLGLHKAQAKPVTLVFDELHKHLRWKSFLKGFFDAYAESCKVMVTGSSRLDIFRRGGDSLMGRYFHYRMHPFSVGELASVSTPNRPIRTGSKIKDSDWKALWSHGGFPEPFLKRNLRFTRRWQALRLKQLTHGDLREVTLIQNLGAMEALTHLLAQHSSHQLVYANLSRELQLSQETAKRWVNILETMHYGFQLRPWYRNIANALKKEPKWYLRDWSTITDEGARAETLVACHLLKAVEGWTDLGLGQYDLFYVRNKQKREVDFLVSKDRVPWFLVEVKLSESKLSESLVGFHRQLGTKHAFQVVVNLPYEQVDCFKYTRPVVVPARTWLSQLL